MWERLEIRELPIVGTSPQSSASKRDHHLKFGLEFWDNSTVPYRKTWFFASEWTTPTGLKLGRENLQSRVKEEGLVSPTSRCSFKIIKLILPVIALAVILEEKPAFKDLFGGGDLHHDVPWVQCCKLRGCRKLPCGASNAGSFDPHTILKQEGVSQK
ncbi:hypothetical protein Tco_0559237 [Tanacetum coccineum]